LRHRIPAELKKGARLNESGALKIEVELGSGIWAVCFASYLGGWEVMTVYRGYEGNRGDYEKGDDEVEEKAEYGNDGEREKLLSKEEYENTQEVLMSQAGMMAMLDLEAFLSTINHAETVAPIVDPTLYQKVLYGRGADNLEAIKEIAAAALKVKAAVERAKERYLERECKEAKQE